MLPQGLKGQWLEELGFERGMPITVHRVSGVFVRWCYNKMKKQIFVVLGAKLPHFFVIYIEYFPYFLYTIGTGGL